MNFLKRLGLDERGQTIVEYTLMIGLVVTVIWVAISVFGIPAALQTFWVNVNSQVSAAPGAGS